MEAEQLDRIRSLDGLFVGMLTADEMPAFEHLVKTGEARRSFSGPAGFLGLAKIELIKPKDA